MDRYLYVQGNCLDTQVSREKMIANCLKMHITDAIVLEPNSDTIAQFNTADIKVHLWWCVGYWPLTWYKNAPSAWKTGSKLNASLPDVQTAIADYAKNIANTVGIAGISLDYFRYSAGNTNTSLSGNDWTKALTAIRENTTGVELSLAGVPYANAGGFNTITCYQPWGEWLNSNLLDRVLVMEYVSDANLALAINKTYQQLPSADKISFIASPVAFYDEYALSETKYANFVDLAIAYNPIVGAFDYSQLSTRPLHAQVLIDRDITQTDYSQIVLSLKEISQRLNTEILNLNQQIAVLESL